MQTWPRRAACRSRRSRSGSGAGKRQAWPVWSPSLILARRRNLSQRDLAKLEKLLLAGAQRAGFDSDLWTCSRIARLIQDRFDVEYHPSHVWKILRRLGWSCQKPERRARERDEAAVEAWRKRDWPRIKKGASA